MLRSIICAMIALVVAAPSLEAQAVLEVPSLYPTIGGALAAALPGDVVRVAAGTYYESIDMPNGVHLMGAGAGATVLSGGPVYAILNDIGTERSTVVQGLTITGSGHGVVIADGDMTLVDCVIVATTAPFWPSGGSALRLSNGKVDLIRCRATGCGGPSAVFCLASPGYQLAMLDCIVEGSSGDGIDAAGVDGMLTMEDCLILGNAGIGVSMGTLPAGSMAHCTLYANGTGMSAPSIPVTDSIVWSNLSAQIAGSPTIGGSVSWCDVQGGYLGTGNIDLDPQFANPGIGDFSLGAGSPCIDAGDPAGIDPDGSVGDMGRRPGLPLLPGFAIGNEDVFLGLVGPPLTSLKINGSSGGLARRVDLASGQAFTVSLTPLPATAGTQNFAILGFLGVPGFADQVVFSELGGLAMPPAIPGVAPAAAFMLTNNIFPDPQALIPSTPAPWSLSIPSGLPPTIQIALQTVIVLPSTASYPVLRSTNAVLLNVY
jgi:hypothetical protein